VREYLIDLQFRGRYFQIGVSTSNNVLLRLSDKVIEIDKTGKSKAEFPVSRAANATVLWNRNLLVSSGDPRTRRIVELNIAGTIVRQVSPPYPGAFASFPVCLELVRFGFDCSQDP